MLDSAPLLEALLKDSGGVAVVMGASSTYGHLDVADEVLLQEAGVTGAKYTLTIADGTLPGVRQDSELTADGDLYEVRRRERVDDGALLRLYLRPL